MKITVTVVRKVTRAITGFHAAILPKGDPDDADANTGVGRVAVVLLIGDEPDPGKGIFAVGVKALLVAVGLQRTVGDEFLPGLPIGTFDGSVAPIGDQAMQ